MGARLTETAAIISTSPAGAGRPGSVGKPAPGVTVRIERPDGGEVQAGENADGYLYVVDRIKDLIIRGGFNVYPRDVEEIMIAHPDVISAVVIGRPDPTYSGEVVAFVQLRPGTEVVIDDLVAYAKEHLPAAKYPPRSR